MGAPLPPLRARVLAEGLGTFLLVFFGLGAVHVAVLTGALAGLLQVALVWGVAIMAAAYAVGGVSGAHINPAVTAALAWWGRFPRREVAPYVAGQLVGAVVAAAVLFLFFRPLLAEKEAEADVSRGQPGSEVTAMCYGEYFPNPGTADAAKAYKASDTGRLNALVSEPVAFVAEVVGTAILALVVFAVTDGRSRIAPSGLAPAFIGLTVAALIAVIAPLTQACFNPARDLGPRLFAFAAGWGTVALPGRGFGFLTVYLIAPVTGAVLGGWLYTRVLAPHVPAPEPEGLVKR